MNAGLLIPDTEKCEMHTQNYKQEDVVGGNLGECNFAFFVSAVTALMLLQLRFFFTLHETYLKPVSSVCVPT